MCDPFNLIFISVQKSKSERARHSKSAIIRGTATKSDNDLLRASLRGIQNHVTDAEGAGKIDIVLIRLQTTHPGGLAHLHDCELSVFDPAITRFDLAAERIVR